MTMIEKTILPGAELTEEQIKEVREAAKRPIVFDEDCPELTDEQSDEMAAEMKKRWSEENYKKILMKAAALWSNYKAGKINEEDFKAVLDEWLDNILDYYMSKDYKIVYEQDDDGGYVAYIPELKGCITQADTLEEAKVMIEDAKKCWLSVAIEDGIEIPEPSNQEEIKTGSNEFLTLVKCEV